MSCRASVLVYAATNHLVVDGPQFSWW